MARNIFILLAIILVVLSAFALSKEVDYEDHPQDEIIELADKQLKDAVKYRCIPNGVRCDGGALQLTPPQRCCGKCSFRSGKCKSYKGGTPDYAAYPPYLGYPPYY